MKNITENNKLIAEFMNLNLYRSFWYKSNIATEKKICKENNLKFHKDWNCLMEVVEKIESIEDGIYQVDILQEGCKILKKCSLLIDKTVSKLEPDTTKIKSVYLACVEFIKWYNEQNKK